MSDKLREALSALLDTFQRIEAGFPPPYELRRAVEDRARAALAEAPGEGRETTDRAAFVSRWRLHVNLTPGQLDELVRSDAISDAWKAGYAEGRRVSADEGAAPACPECGHSDDTHGDPHGDLGCTGPDGMDCDCPGWRAPAPSEGWRP